MDDIESLVGALVILREYATVDTSLRTLIETSFDCSVEVLEEEMLEGVRCIVHQETGL